jgi:riboflavin kinase / FMN adenylyltransferase
MRLLRRLTARAVAPLRQQWPNGAVAAIGGFDGIHLGHQALIARARALAAAAGQASMVLTFEPLPKEYFAAGAPPARLTSFRERWRLLAQDGPDIFCVLRFDDQLRAMTAKAFVQMLCQGGIKTLVIGPDFRAGYRGEADCAWFQEQAPKLGVKVDVLAPVAIDAVRVSSGGIRRCLAAGRLDDARQLLGRRYSMRGRVIRGQQLGRTLGFPTANLQLARRQTPMVGIFAVRVRAPATGAAAALAHDGVASLGTRPVVGGTEPLLEAHIFNFTGDLYGREIEVEFVARLRDERNFETMDAMVVQMHHDAAAARAALAAAQAE